MHEYRLYTTIPAARQTQVLNILAGITASQPVSITQQVLIYQQLKPENAPAAKKGQAKPSIPAGQQQRLNHVKVVRDVDASSGNGAADGKESGAGEWRLRAEGLPDPAAKTVISQSVAERELVEPEVVKFQPDSESYKYVSQYLSSGMRFIHHNTVVSMTRLYTAALSNSGKPDPLNAPYPVLDNGRLLDPSGAWLMEVCVRVDDGGNSSLRDRAVKELEGFRRDLEGAVDLRCPDRLALDPRVR